MQRRLKLHEDAYWFDSDASRNTYSISNEANEVWVDSDNYLHREDGPAWQCGNTRQFWIHGYEHREDGPAQEQKQGGGKYALYSKRFDSKKEWKEGVKKLKEAENK